MIDLKSAKLPYKIGGEHVIPPEEEASRGSGSTTFLQKVVLYKDVTQGYNITEFKSSNTRAPPLLNWSQG